MGQLCKIFVYHLGAALGICMFCLSDFCKSPCLHMYHRLEYLEIVYTSDGPFSFLIAQKCHTVGTDVVYPLLIESTREIPFPFL